MIEHVGFRVEHRIERGFIAVEIGNQYFDLAVRIERAHGFNGRGPVCGAPVRQVVAIYGCYDGMGQFQVSDGFGDMFRFCRIKCSRGSFADRAEAAMPRADVAAQHEGGGAIRPALKNIRTLCFLTNGVKIEPFDQFQNMILI